MVVLFGLPTDLLREVFVRLALDDVKVFRRVSRQARDLADASKSQWREVNRHTVLSIKEAQRAAALFEELDDEPLEVEEGVDERDDHAWTSPQRAVRSAAMKVFRGLLRGTARSGGTEEREAVATWAAKRRQDLGVVALACTVVSGLTGDEPLDARPEFIDERRRVIGQLRGVQAALHWHKWALDKGVLQPADLIAKLD